MLFSIAKHSFPKIQGQLIPTSGVISEVVKSKDKTNSDILARLIVRILSIYVLSLGSFPVSLRGGSLQSKRATYQHQNMEIK